MTAVLVLQEHVGEGVRVLGVFATPAEAASAARKYAEKKTYGSGLSVGDALAKLIVSTFALGVLEDT